jgi:hypothetical protein
MNEMIRRMALAAVGLGLLACGSSAFAQGAVQAYSYDGKTFMYEATDLAGNTYLATFTGNRGDFLRQNPDGSYWIHADSNEASVQITPAGFPFPVIFGTVNFSFSGTVDAAVQPDGSYFWTTNGIRSNVHAVGQVTDLLGNSYDLFAQAVMRDQVFVKYEVDLTPE